MANGGDKAHHPAPTGAEAKTVKVAKSDKQSTPKEAAKPRTK